MRLCGQSIHSGVGPLPYFAARLITSAMYPFGRERCLGDFSSRIKRIRDDIAPEEHAAPRSWPSMPYSGFGISPVGIIARASHSPHGALGVETNIPHRSILIVGNSSDGASPYSANGLARTPRGPSVSTTGTSRAEHASPRPGHIPRGRCPHGLTREFPYSARSRRGISAYIPRGAPPLLRALPI